MFGGDNSQSLITLGELARQWQPQAELPSESGTTPHSQSTDLPFERRDYFYSGKVKQNLIKNFNKTEVKKPVFLRPISSDSTGPIELPEIDSDSDRKAAKVKISSKIIPDRL